VPVSSLRDIELQLEGAAVPAALALPDGDERHPALLVLSELFGLTGDLRTITARLAREGYAALAPELYGPGRRLVCISRAIRDLTRAGSELGLERTAQAFQALRERPEVDPERVGAIGFCMGGGFALLLGAREPLAAVSVNYGHVPERVEELAGICPVVASYGGRDPQLVPQAERLERFLTERDVPHDVKMYPRAGHGFLNHSIPPLLQRTLRPLAVVGFNPEAAEDAWGRILAFLETHVRRVAA
jgi:carboxymethylenebutenolidase